VISEMVLPKGDSTLWVQYQLHRLCMADALFSVQNEETNVQGVWLK
jgi:hypothetical protein